MTEPPTLDFHRLQMKLALCRIMSQALVPEVQRSWSITRLVQVLEEQHWHFLGSKYVALLLSDSRLFEPLVAHGPGSSYYILKCDLEVAQGYLNEDVIAFGDRLAWLDKVPAPTQWERLLGAGL